MKKLFALIVCITLFCGVKAQEQHLSFKGVPIDGTLKEYTNAMVKAGFKIEETTNDGVARLSGDFAGYKGCIVYVSTLNNLDVVNRIEVLFPRKETWSSIMADYEHIKSLLTTKYGKPSMTTERFTGPSARAVSDGLKMSALRTGNIEWFTIFSSGLGDIELTVVAASCDGRVKLTYFDKKNTEAVRQNALDDL